MSATNNNNTTRPTVIITGGTKGIGKATALAFAKKGYNVVVSARDVSRTADLLEAIEKAGGKGLAVSANVGKEQDIISLIKETVEKFGKLDVMVNNAGTVGDHDTFLADITNENFENVLNINVWGTFWGMKYAIKEMLKSGGGAIVNTGSLFGDIGAAYFSAATAAKHAVNGLTRAAALEYGPQGIRINAVAPGFVVTDLFSNIVDKTTQDDNEFVKKTPMGKLGRPEDIANGIVYLASPENSFVTGVVLPIDGGYAAQ